MSDLHEGHPAAAHHVLRARLRSHLARNLVVAAAVLIVSLSIGVAGYRLFAGLSWIDAFLNAAMLLGGMGPVSELPNDRAKLFAGFYAIYCGVVFIASVGIVLTPVALHVLRRFHIENR